MHRYRTQAHRTASQRSLPTVANQGVLLPSHTTSNLSKSTEAGGLDEQDGPGGPPSRLPAARARRGTPGGGSQLDGIRDIQGGDLEKPTHNDTADSTSQSRAPSTPPPDKSEDASPGDSAIESTEQDQNKKPPIPTRMKNGCLRFIQHLKNAIFRSWINILLIAVPAGIAAGAAKITPGAIFGINAVAIIPLAGLLAHATEAVASRLGDTWGALLNVSFGNAVELIIFIIALAKDEINIVQASLLGSILANLLLILGMAFLFGGLRFREQIYNSTVTQMSACLLSLSVMSLLLPTAFHASFNQSSAASADTSVLKVSRGTSVVLLLVYILYLLFQLKSHAYMYESTPQEVIDEESHPGVLHDMMNSSSSESSSSDSSSDSDSSDSGSIATRTKKMKRMFKHRKRRKSSASASSGHTGDKSVLSSPSTQERQDPMGSGSASRRGSHHAPITATPDDADAEDNSVSRVFDWAKRHPSNDGNKSVEIEPQKRHKKHSKKKHRKHRKERKEEIDAEKDVIVEEKPQQDDIQPKVGFADDVEVVPFQQNTTQPSKLPFNMRQISSRTPGLRPVMQKMLSNNVFAQPAPQPATRPSITRSQSAGNLRRTNSLPDRLNRQTTPGSTSGTTRSDALPPYQHRRVPVRKVNSGMSQEKDDDDEEPEEQMSRTAATVMLLVSTGLVAVCAEFMVDAIPEIAGDSSGLSEAFIGLIILPIVGNAAEHVTAVTVATKNKMDLAIGVAIGSSIQIALFVTPVVVLLGWILNTNMSLYFNLFETISLFVTAFVVNFLILDGRSNYLEGSLLIAAYIIIALVAFFYPASGSQSDVGGGAGSAA
ncbi:Vacuolar calcium ion transporter [Lecanosticta acicola]|uniref:Vacuolar calcium ion transporter n=1 Tax=Lecanosticta acicola TaxID=111012 RepID=A0AAI9E984_9PEZI|nr:Vacuolar calcium ion transporter [Lecanosticta acicola]